MTNLNEFNYDKEGIHLVYKRFGKGKTLFFLHGAGVDSDTYMESLNVLSNDFEIIAPDIPCFGKSGIPEKIWDFEDYGRFFSDFIDSLGIKDIILIGHSFGGGVSAAVSKSNKKISKLVLVNSAGIPIPYPVYMLILKIIIKGVKDTLLMRNTTAKSMMKNFLLLLLNRPKDLKKVLKISIGSIYKSYDFFRDIDVKTFILWGENDELFKKHNASLLKSMIKNSEITYISGCHDWCILNPKKFSEELKKIILN